MKYDRVMEMPSHNPDVDEVVRIARLCAQVILENGGETYRAEETVDRICGAFGYEADVFATPTGVFITVSKDGAGTSTTIRRIRRRRANLQSVETVNSVSRSLTAGKISAEDALGTLHALSEQKAESNALFIVSAGLASAFSALLFKGSAYDFIAAALCGMLVQLVSGYIKMADFFNFAVSVLGGLLIGAWSVAFVKITGVGDLQKIITGAIMPLLPGIPMTNAIRDTMRGDLLSGVARGAEALLIAVSLAFGAGVALKIYLQFLH